MATYYEITNSMVWVYSTIDGQKVGSLRAGAVVPAEIIHTSTDWLVISSDGFSQDSIKNLSLGNVSAGNAFKATSETGRTVYKRVDTVATDTAQETTQEEEADEIVFYNAYMTDDEYNENIEQGLLVKDLRGILGMPHQFLPITDIRIDGSKTDGAFGRVYAEKIIAKIPLLLMTPGVPTFMNSYNSEQKKTVLSKFLTKGIDIIDGELDVLVNENSGKYYSLKYDYTDYFYYVNAMLRSAAYFLGIEDETVDGKKLGTFNWLFYSNDDNDIFGHEGLNRFLGTYAGAIPFYISPDTTVSDSFSNSTTKSAIADQINGLSDQGRELNYILGNVSGLSGLKLDRFTGQDDLASNIENVNNAIGDLLPGSNIFKSVINKAQTILAGGRMVFPEIWSDSSFGRSYSVKMKLVSPSGDKLSVFLNILVPIYHLLAFTLPRQSAGQAYYSPFLVRACYKGTFNVDMGIITDLSITKGDEGEWTVDGLPTVADVSFEIKDLYEGMYMSTAQDLSDLNILNNITELDYIANSCGININEPEILRTIEMYFALNLSGRVKDTLSIKMLTGVSQYFNQKFTNIFGKF